MTILVSMAKGTSRQINIPVRDEAGNPFDMTGGKAVFWVGTCAVGGEIVIQKDAPTITVDGSGASALWTIGVSLAPADTQNLQALSSYYCECRVWDQSDNEYVIAAGGFEITQSITVDAPEP